MQSFPKIVHEDPSRNSSTVSLRRQVAEVSFLPPRWGKIQCLPQNIIACPPISFQLEGEGMQR